MARGGNTVGANDGRVGGELWEAALNWQAGVLVGGWLTTTSETGKPVRGVFTER